MIKYIKNRSINPDKPVKVYWNLHRNCYSVQQNGLVVAHTDKIKLTDVTFKVSEAGRQRVLKERKKNVHAFVIGYLDEWNMAGSWDSDNRYYSIKVVYNPYKYDSFMADCEMGQRKLKYSRGVSLTTVDGKGNIRANRFAS